MFKYVGIGYIAYIYMQLLGHEKQPHKQLADQIADFARGSPLLLQAALAILASGFHPLGESGDSSQHLIDLIRSLIKHVYISPVCFKNLKPLKLAET